MVYVPLKYINRLQLFITLLETEFCVCERRIGFVFILKLRLSDRNVCMFMYIENNKHM